MQSNIIYQVTVKTTNNEEKYTYELPKDPGNREPRIKTSFNNNKYANSTKLLKNICELMNKNQNTPNISWKIRKTAPAYNNNSVSCKLRLEKKIAIIVFPDQDKLINKRSNSSQNADRKTNVYFVT